MYPNDSSEYSHEARSIDHIGSVFPAMLDSLEDNGVKKYNSSLFCDVMYFSSGRSWIWSKCKKSKTKSQNEKKSEKGKVKRSKSQRSGKSDAISQTGKSQKCKSQSDKRSNDRRVKMYKSQWIFKQIKLHLAGMGWLG